MLYGFSSVSNLFNICGLYWSASGRVGEQGLITDERLMITDFVHTENTEGKGGPQADEVGEQQLSSIGQQLKENYFFNCRSRKRDGGMWSGMSSNIQEFIGSPVKPCV